MKQSTKLKLSDILGV